MQNWGGPVGMGFSVRHPDRVRAFVVGNTWAWPIDKPGPKVVSRVLGGPPGRLLVRRLNVFSKVFIPKGMNKRELTEAEHAMYLGPHPNPASREPVQVMPRELRTARPLLEEVEAGLDRVADRPALLAWATGDRIFGDDELARWQSIFHDPRTLRLEGAGHYLWEDEPHAIAAAIREWHPERAGG